MTTYMTVCGLNFLVCGFLAALVIRDLYVGLLWACFPSSCTKLWSRTVAVVRAKDSVQDVTIIPRLYLL